MKAAILALVLLSTASNACVVYEYEHEFWLRVDGSGTVNVTGRPGLWSAFKGLEAGAGTDAQKASARALFEQSGLYVRRVAVARRDGRTYLFVSADFEDLNRLSGTPAFPDLRLSLSRGPARLGLHGAWRKPETTAGLPAADHEGLMAVRFHLPSKVYAHNNAFAGVERGNILSWRQTVSAAATNAVEFGAEMDARSFRGSTVTLFAAAIALAVGILGLALWLTLRRGRRDRAT